MLAMPAKHALSMRNKDIYRKYQWDICFSSTLEAGIQAVSEVNNDKNAGAQTSPRRAVDEIL
jgi:hypothetical protein